MSNVVIRTELESRVKTWADSQTPKIPVAYQNITFTKPVSGVWLEVFNIPNGIPLRGINGVSKTFLGLFQIQVWGLKGEGMRKIEAIVDSLIGVFPVVPKYGVVSIEKNSVGSPVQDDSGWVAVPILVNYRYET